ASSQMAFRPRCVGVKPDPVSPLAGRVAGQLAAHQGGPYEPTLLRNYSYPHSPRHSRVRRAGSDQEEQDEPTREPEERDHLCDGEAQPHQRLQLLFRLGLPSGGGNRRHEDEADTDRRPERSETEREPEPEPLPEVCQRGYVRDEEFHSATTLSARPRNVMK